MNTIKQGLNDAYKKAGPNAYFGNGFNAGVDFAQQWINVKNETPLAHESGNWNGKRSDLVLAKNNTGDLFIARTYEGIFDGNKFCNFTDRNDKIIPNIIEWRPIVRS